MGIVMTQRERIRQLEAENAQLTERNEMLEGHLAYVAMMTDVELPEEETSHEQNV